MEETMEYKLCVPCLLGLEGPIADELRRLDMKDVAAENGIMTRWAKRQRFIIISFPAERRRWLRPTSTCASASVCW